MSMTPKTKSPSRRLTSAGIVALLGFLAFVCSSCRTLPDLKPFADATAAVDLAASEAHDFVMADLAALQQQLPADRPERKALKDASTAFSSEWTVRLDATAALTEYAAS